MKFPTPTEFVKMTPDEFAAFWDAFDKLGMAKQAPFAGRWFTYGNEIRDMITLKRGGWSPSLPTPMAQPMSWFWRRPIRPGSRDRLGKMFTSPNAALCEMRRDEAKKSNVVQNFAIQLIIDGKPFVGSLPAKGILNAERLADNIGATLIAGDSSPVSVAAALSAPTRATSGRISIAPA